MTELALQSWTEAEKLEFARVELRWALEAMNRSDTHYYIERALRWLEDGPRRSDA